MNVTSLTISNILRLTAVSIIPKDNMIVIGGENGAGKSSVLNAIAMALGGEKLVPQVPIHGHELEGRIEVDLGEFVVTRKFKRDRITCLCPVDQLNAEPAQTLHTEQCKREGGRYSEIRSTLTVKTKDNAAYSSPQTMLDKLVSKLSFDPLEFSQADAKVQYQTLANLVKLDTKAADEKYRIAYEKRRDHNAEVKRLENQLTMLPHYNGIPEDEISVNVVSDKMLAAERARTAAETLDKALDTVKDLDKQYIHEVGDLTRRVSELQELLKKTEVTLQEKQELRASNILRENELAEKLRLAQEAIPDINVIRMELSGLEETNRKVRAQKDRFKTKLALDAAQGAANKNNKALEDALNEKEQALAAIKFPIEGLSFKDGEVLFNHLPLKQASTAEQLRISVAIGIALHPNLKVLLIRRGSDLDSKSLAAVAEQADASDTQIWIERVAESKDGVTVMIEDGHVA